jgi:hypothetical protein
MLLAAQVPPTPLSGPLTAPAALVNSGEPIRIPFQCTNDDMEWAGMSCTEDEPCPVYVELAAVEPVGNHIVLAGNIHSSSSTLYSLLLSSEDAGKTWTEPYDRMRGTVLDRIQFIDLETGWVAGQVLVPVAQDPFLLLTSDSGKTWRKRPVFGENRAGTIADFWFGTRTGGSLLIDRSQSGEEGRYELYESMTGGESWMLREVNDKPIGIRRPPAGNTDWRIHPDAPSKSFQIERHQGEKWVTLASFLVSIATCKPIEPPAPATTPPNGSGAEPATASDPKQPASVKPPRK